MDTKQINEYCLSLKNYINENYRELEIDKYLLEDEDYLLIKIVNGEQNIPEQIINLKRDLEILLSTRNTIFYDLDIQLCEEKYKDNKIFRNICIILLYIDSSKNNVDKELVMTYNHETERVYMCKVYNILGKIYSQDIVNIIIDYL